MKSAFFIMEMWQQGNVGSHQIKKLKENKEDGYATYDEAKEAMLTLKENGNWTLNKSRSTFAIMEIFS